VNWCNMKMLGTEAKNACIYFWNEGSCFESLSLYGRLNGCVGALDGWLCRIKVPSENETYNVGSYFSGHYQSYGVKVQEACDSNSHFTFIFVLCPGGTGDSRAYAASYLHSYVSNLPLGFYLVADYAYTIFDMLLILNSGQYMLDPSKDTFNFYLSQLFTRIEQAFGILVSKWIFKKPMEVKLFCVSHIVQACTWLHHFCMDNREDSVPLILNHDPESFHLLWGICTTSANITNSLSQALRCLGGNSCSIVWLCSVVLVMLWKWNALLKCAGVAILDRFW
jgi:hypothetical protein